MVVNATLVGNIARFANHSCQPNAPFMTITYLSSLYAVVVIEALRFIPPGMEVTVDYGWVSECLESLIIFECGAPCCRSYIRL